MAKRKNHYYVLVMTNEGPVFVTGIPERNWANWNKTEKPFEFQSKELAQEIANGLTLNWNLAYMVTTQYELESQPYRYADGKLTWEYNKEDK